MGGFPQTCVLVRVLAFSSTPAILPARAWNAGWLGLFWYAFGTFWNSLQIRFNVLDFPKWNDEYLESP